MADTAIKSLPRPHHQTSRSKPRSSKKGALGRFVSFIRGKNGTGGVIPKKGSKARQKSSDSTSSGVSSKGDHTLHSDENIEGNRLFDPKPNHPSAIRPSIRVIRNNNQIPTTGIINNPVQPLNKRTQSTRCTTRQPGTLGIHGGQNARRSNTIAATKRLSKHHGITSDSSTSSSTGYLSDGEKRKDKKTTRKPGRINISMRRDDSAEDSSSSSDSYTSSDDSLYSSDDNFSKPSRPKAREKSRNYKDSDEDLTKTSHANTNVTDNKHKDDDDTNRPLQLEVIHEADEEIEEKSVLSQLQKDKKKRQLRNRTVSQDRLSKNRLQLSLQQNKSLSNLKIEPTGSNHNISNSPTKNTPNANPNSPTRTASMLTNSPRKARQPFHSFHGNASRVEANEQLINSNNDECLLAEALRETGRSHSTDNGLKPTGSRDRLHWRRQRRSYMGDTGQSSPTGASYGQNNALRSQESMNKSTSRIDQDEKASGNVRALAQKIQAQTAVQDSEDPYLATQFQRAKKFFRSGSQEGHINSKSHDNVYNEDIDDDPLYELPSNLTTRRAGMSQVREGRASISRKSSFPSAAAAQQANQMSVHPSDQALDDKGKDKHSSYSRYEQPTVVRSTSRVKQIAMSLHEKETTVRKTEAMIANHQPLSEGKEGSSDHNSVGHPSPIHKRPATTPKTNKTDDSFIKELLEIARAESQEKQKHTEVANLHQAVLNNNAKVSYSQSRRGKLSNEQLPQSVSAQLVAQQRLMEEERNAAQQQMQAHAMANGADGQPKDFKEAISMASNRFTRRKGSRDELDDHSADGSSSTTDNPPAEPVVRVRSRGRLISGSDYQYQSNVSIRAKMFEKQEDSNNLSHSRGHLSNTNHNDVNNHTKYPIQNQYSNSSGIYSGTPDDDIQDFPSYNPYHSNQSSNEADRRLSMHDVCQAADSPGMRPKQKKVTKKVRRVCSSNKLYDSRENSPNDNHLSHNVSHGRIDNRFNEDYGESVNMSNLHGTSQEFRQSSPDGFNSCHTRDSSPSKMSYSHRQYSREASPTKHLSSMSFNNHYSRESSPTKMNFSTIEGQPQEVSSPTRRTRVIKKKKVVRKVTKKNNDLIPTQSLDKHMMNSSPDSADFNSSRNRVSSMDRVSRDNLANQHEDPFLVEILNSPSIPYAIKSKIRDECWSLFNDSKTPRTVKQCILDNMVAKLQKV